MDTVITNAKVYLERGRFAQGIYISGGIIRAVGTNEEVLAAAPADADLVNAGGNTIVPGFNDSHMHLYMFGELLQSIDLHAAASKADVKRLTEEFIARVRPAPGTVLHGNGWNQDYFTDDATMLTRHDLDAITTAYPLVFSRACGHAVTASTSAMRMAGVTANTPQPEGARFDLDENGEPNGIFREGAAGLLAPLDQAPDAAFMDNTLRLAMEEAARYGITSVQTMDITQANFPEMIAAYERRQAGCPTLRVYHQSNFMSPEAYRAFLALGHKTGAGTPFLKYGPLKLFVDGSLGARTAMLRGPYADDASASGIRTMTQAQSDEMVQLADENGCQVAVHAIGDAAIEQVLNSYDTVCRKSNSHRHGIVHCQITDRALVERFAQNDILAYIQPIFLHYDLTILESRVGKELAAQSYAFHTMNLLGLHTSLGTDCPVEHLNTLHNLYCAVTRKTLNGQPAGGFCPSECMDIYEAVDGYTAGSAYASFEEGVKGRIKPGYYADLAFLDQDIFENDPEVLLSAKVTATMVDGRFVYRAEAL